MGFQIGSTNVSPDYTLQGFDVEVSYGATWVSLNDQITYRIRAEDFGNSAYQRRRITTDSPYYDGTFYLHSTLENVQESVAVQVMGYSPNHVTENINSLIYYFSQDSFNLRKRLDDHIETWLCQPADYGIDRSHVLMHNNIAVVKFSVPRSPKVSYEVVM